MIARAEPVAATPMTETHFFTDGETAFWKAACLRATGRYRLVEVERLENVFRITAHDQEVHDESANALCAPSQL
jgi:hypothetical protein